MRRANVAAVLRHVAAGGRWVLTFDRDCSELVLARVVPSPPADVCLRQRAYAPYWTARVLPDPLPRADLVEGHFLFVLGHAARHWCLPAA